MDNQTLQLLIQASAENATKAVNKLKSSLSGFKQGFEDATGQAATFGNVMWRLGKVSLAGLITGISKLATSLRASIDRAEELNLFNVVFNNMEKNGVKTFSTLGREATKFQNKLNETFGTNMTDTLRYQALFQSMGENTGIKDTYASIMSENLTKLTYDLASLYNTSEKSTAEALKSGIYAGQTKPLRKFGVDVTQGSLAPLLTELGIDDRTISQMSQAEKQILRYIATMKQAQVAMGDFADTIESPANQLKILKNQFAELRVAIGNLFIGLFNQILPYANAVIMVLKELAKAIAGFFGIEVRDYNSGLSALEDTKNAYDGIGSSAGKAAKAAKELNRQTLKFDQINNIKSPSKSGSGSGGGSGNLVGGIDKRLLDSIKGYDNLMDKVKMKATEIRDRWMEILGFKKVVNPLTGAIEFKYQGLGTTIKNLAKWFDSLSGKAKLLVSLGLVTIFSKLLSPVGKLVTLFGESGLVGGIKKFTTGVGLAYSGSLLLNDALDDMRLNGMNTANTIEGLGGALGTVFGGVMAGSTFGPIGALIGGIATGIYALVEAFGVLGHEIDTEFNKLADEHEKAITKTNELRDSVLNMKDSWAYADSEMSYYEDLISELDRITDSNGKVKDGYEERAKTVTGLLANSFGVEIECIDGVIKNYEELRKEILKNIEEKKALAKLTILEDQWKTALGEVVKAQKEAKEAAELLNGYISDQDIVVGKLAKSMGMTREEAENFLLTASDEAWDMLPEEISRYKDEYDGLTEKIKEQNGIYLEAVERVKLHQDTIENYEKAYGMAMEKNYDALNDFFDGEAQLLGASDEERKTYWREQVKDTEKNLKELAKKQGEYDTDEYNKLVETYNNKLKYAQDHFDRLEAITKTKNGEITDDVIKQWIKMGEESVELATIEFQKLPPDIQEKLKQKMGEAGNYLGEVLNSNMIEGLTPEEQELFKKAQGVIQEMQKGFNSITLSKTVTLKGDDTDLKNKLNNIRQSNAFKKVQEVLKLGVNYKALGGVFSGGSWKNIPQYANGGVPRHGSLALMGENGPEIVGHVNRRTEVLNRSQIASAIYSAVASAMSNANLGGGEVHLYAHTDEGVIIDRINQKTKQTGRCPINIPA